jgi:hypothetical protein
MAVEYQGKGSTKGIVLQLESKRPWQDTLDLRKRTLLVTTAATTF